MPGLGQLRVIRLRRGRAWGVAGVHPVLLVAKAVAVVPAFILQATRRLEGEPVVVTEQHHVCTVKAHVWADPWRREVCRAVNALRRASGLEGEVGGEMRLANHARRVTGAPQGPTESSVADRIREINTVVGYTVCGWEHAGQNACARGLANHVRRNAG